MSFFSKIASLFSRAGREEELLRQAMEHAKANQPGQAIAIYNSLVDSASTNSDLRARALFNRALAHSAAKDDDRAMADLAQVLTIPGLAENIQIAARSQLARVRKRNERRTKGEPIAD
jgi:hypothetical protein